MNITVGKIGNSEGVILPREIVDHLNVRSGDTLVAAQDAGQLRPRRLESDPKEFERKMRIARERMKKYETAYRAAYLFGIAKNRPFRWQQADRARCWVAAGEIDQAVVNAFFRDHTEPLRLE